MVSLRRREADVAIRLSNDPSESLIGRRLGRLNFAVYGSKALIERIGADQPLSAYPWIHQDERTDTRWFDQWLHTHAPHARVVLRQDHYAVRRASVQAGLGLCLLPCKEQTPAQWPPGFPPMNHNWFGRKTSEGCFDGARQGTTDHTADVCVAFRSQQARDDGCLV